MAAGQPPPQIGTDNTAMLIVLVLVGVPFVFIIYKICAGLKADEPKSRKKKSKKELEEEADDPMAWFAGKLNDMAMKREEAKVEKKQGGNVTPEQLWTMLDANKDGILSMGEFKKGVMKNESLQYLLFTGNNPDVKTMKAVFKNMHDLHKDEAEITKAHFMEYWNEVDTDKSGTITKAEVQAAAKKGK